MSGNEGAPVFDEQDFTGARFHRVRLNDSTFEQVRFDGSTFESFSFEGVRFHGGGFVNCEINADIWNVTWNGVEIGPLINAELNRRDPERALVFQEEREEASIEDYRAGWDVIGDRWAETIERVRAMAAGSEHVSVNGEWSLVQTLRHVSYAVAVWIERVAMGVAEPLVDTDLTMDQAPPEVSRGVGRDVQVPLDAAVAVWERRRDAIREFLAGLTQEELVTGRRNATSPGYPQVEDFAVSEAVHIGITEAWEHREFAERDLTILAERDLTIRTERSES